MSGHRSGSEPILIELVGVGVGVYLHLLVHFHIDGFDFVQLMPESDQRVLLTGERLIMSRSHTPPHPTHVPLPSVTADWLAVHL